MKIKLYKNTYLHVYSRFYTKNEIVSLGSDCHSAYILNSLKLRKKSYPFDWLFSDSRYGIQYVTENIKNNFEFFLTNLTRNERGHIISENYPNTEFFHEKELIESETDRAKMLKRAIRFSKLIKSKKCSFLYVINPEHFKDIKDIYILCDSIQEFFKVTPNHKIFIFIKCKEYVIDFTFINKLIEECNKINDVKAVKYFLNTKIYGQWGKSNDYYPLLKGLGLGVKKNILPQIYIK